jgi:hypothetical protein
MSSSACQATTSPRTSPASKRRAGRAPGISMTFKRGCALSALACVLGVLSGCVTIYEGKYAFNDGWRMARVEEVGTASTIRGAALSDCRSTATTEQLATGTFALLSYVDFGHLRRRIAVLPAHAAYVKLRSCSGDVARSSTSPHRVPGIPLPHPLGGDRILQPSQATASGS